MPSSTSSSKTYHLPPPSSGEKKRKAGRRKFQETRHPVYKGVRQRNGKWVCELRQPKRKSTVWVGTFASSKMAAVAHDVVALALKGDSAALNFPNLAHSFPRLTSSSSITDIRRTAVEVAEAFSSGDTSSSPLPSLGSFLMPEEKVEPEVSLESLVMDEDELFNMPAIIAGMAEGLILTPPGMKRSFSWEEYETTGELSLWSND